MKKRVLSCLMVAALAFSSVPTAFAASAEAQTAAQALHDLGLFNGTGTDASGKPNFALDRSLTRSEATAMLVRLLGKEAYAKAGYWNKTFNDVDRNSWAKPYIDYAVTTGLVSGTSSRTFSGSASMTASQYLTLVLRALGYESGTDFQWDKAWELSDQIGLTSGQYNENTKTFTRGDVAVISYNALSIPLKDQSGTLKDEVKSTSPTSLTLKGIWRTTANDNANKYEGEYVFDDSTYTEATIENDGCISFTSGTYTLSGYNFTFDCSHIYTIYNTSANKFQKYQNTIQRTDQLSWINENSFIIGNAIYHRVSDSEIIPQVQSQLGNYFFSTEITGIRKDITNASNALSDGLQASLKSSSYNAKAKSTFDTTTRLQYQQYEQRYFTQAQTKFVTAKSNIIDIKAYANQGKSDTRTDIVSRCDRMIELCDGMIDLDSMSPASLSTISKSITEIYNQLTEVVKLLNK